MFNLISSASLESLPNTCTVWIAELWEHRTSSQYSTYSTVRYGNLISPFFRMNAIESPIFLRCFSCAVIPMHDDIPNWEFIACSKTFGNWAVGRNLIDSAEDPLFLDRKELKWESHLPTKSYARNRTKILMQHSTILPEEVLLIK